MKLATHTTGVILAAILCLNLCDIATAQTTKPFIPRISGLLKARFENDTQTGDVRFNVNNTRLGIGGSHHTNCGTLRYQFQAELNAEGKFTILDTYAAYSIGPFEISAGQQQYHFGTELNRGPRFNYFVNPALLTTYIGSYYADSPTGIKTGNFGSRDIGIIFRYNNGTRIPVNVLAGFVNGSGINHPMWRKSLNFVARLWIEPGNILQGFGAALNLYTGSTPFGERITRAGAELRYIDYHWRIEGEFAFRNLNRLGGNDRMDLAVLHAIYFQPVNGWGVVKFLAPMARWDCGRNISLLNENSDLVHFNAERATAGLTVGFAETLLKCELRINYEHFFIRRKPVALMDNPAFHNKFIVEFFLAF